MKIVGIEQKTGDYQGRQYNNFVIHCLEADNKVIGGYKCNTVKIKYANMVALCPVDQLNTWIGRTIVNVFYDKYGNAVNVQFA